VREEPWLDVQLALGLPDAAAAALVRGAFNVDLCPCVLSPRIMASTNRDKRSLLDDDASGSSSDESSGELYDAQQQQRVSSVSATDRFTVSQLAEREHAAVAASGGGGTRDSDARAMAAMREEREKAQMQDETLEEHADMVLTIMKPVSITMVIVIFLVKAMSVPKLNLSPGQVLWYQEQSNASDQTQQITGALITGAIVLVGVLLATTAFILLYKYRCLKIIYGWLLTASGLLLAMFGGGILYTLIRSANFAVDWISFGFALWNFAVCGLVSIFWYAPPKLQQTYLVIISVLMAVVLTQLPEWSTWVVLGIISVYDLFAVLCPKGPLKVLLDTAQERNEAIPALLYSAAVWIFMVRIVGQDNDTDAAATVATNSIAAAIGAAPDRDALDVEGVVAAAPSSAPVPLPRPTSQQQQQQHQQQQRPPRATGYDEPEPFATAETIAKGRGDDIAAAGVPAPERRKGIQLGLGDFVFYSVLVGRAALSDMSTVYTCFVAVITGLFLTLLLLDVFKRALPALPISIGLGIAFYFLTYIFVLPFVIELQRAGVFV